MAENMSLISFGNLTKPATVLIEKISNAIGVLYEPTQIRRKSEAEADAARILAISRLEISDMERRALERLIKQEARKQENIESIIDRTIELLPEHANGGDIENDWIVHFFKCCENISDDQMQLLWARILAGEAGSSMRFSLRTLNFVASMNKYDADCFSDFCQFLWSLSGKIEPLVYDYKKVGFNYSVMLHLESIGLISHRLEGYGKSFEDLDFYFSYHDNPPVKLNLIGKVIDSGIVMLTQLGLELPSICQPVKNEEFYCCVLEYWTKKNYYPYSPIKLDKKS